MSTIYSTSFGMFSVRSLFTNLCEHRSFSKGKILILVTIFCNFSSCRFTLYQFGNVTAPYWQLMAHSFLASE